MTQSEGAGRTAPGHSVGATPRYRTRTGIVIGGAYEPPAFPLSGPGPRLVAISSGLQRHRRMRQSLVTVLIVLASVAAGALARWLGVA